MTLALPPDIVETLAVAARTRGGEAETLALSALRDAFPPQNGLAPAGAPANFWEWADAAVSSHRPASPRPLSYTSELEGMPPLAEMEAYNTLRRDGLSPAEAKERIFPPRKPQF